MKRLLLTVIFFVLLINSISAQIYVDNQGNVYDQRQTSKTNKNTNQYTKVAKSSSKFDKRKLEFGGSLGLQFGNYTLVNISPQVGYRFSNLLSAGVGIGYSYYSDSKDRYYDNYDYTEHFASFNLYANIYPVSFLVFSLKPEISRVWINQKIGSEQFSDNKFVPSVVIGGGVRLGPMTAQILYDVVQDRYSPYGNKIFYSVGYTFGF